MLPEMRHFLKLRVVFVVALVSGISVHAANSATQTVTFSITAINEFSVSGNPATMTVSSASAGTAPASVTDKSTLYAITTNASNAKITAAIDSAMPPGVVLQIHLAAPTGASSAGGVPLRTTAVDVVTGIARLNERGKGIAYTLLTSADAAAISPQSRTITLTVTAASI